MNPIRKISLAAAAFLFASCGANESVLKSGKETPASTNSTPASTVSAFEQDLASMRTADFRWIYVLRRKDGAVIDAEDRQAIKINTVHVNRRVGTEPAPCNEDEVANKKRGCNKAFILGTNTEIPPHNLLALYQRFAVDDYSPEPPSANTAANSNSNK